MPQRIAKIATLVAAILCSWVLAMHVRMVVSAAPQEMREGAVVWITRLLLEGRNPYSLAELPASTNVYGIVYHIVVLPFAWLFGNSFLVHRAIAAVSILGACALMYRVLRREGADELLAWVGTLLFYVSSVYFVAPVARPDGFGVLLLMASISLLFKDRVTRSEFAWGLAFALLGAGTKLYFIFPLFVFAAYTFLFRSRRDGLIYLGISAAALIAWLSLLTALLPGYVTVTLSTNLETSYNSSRVLIGQTKNWLAFSLPLTLAFALVIWRTATTRSVSWLRTRPTIFAFASAGNAFVFFYWLGWHPGAYMTYLFQLLTPVLLPAVLPQFSSTSWQRASIAAALPVAVVFGFYTRSFPLTPSRFVASERTFAEVGQRIDAHRNVLGATEVAGLLALRGRPVLDSGQCEYFREAVGGHWLPGALPEASIERRWNAFMDGMVDDIRDRRFDLIVRSDRRGLIPNDVVRAHYHPVAWIGLDFVWADQKWPIELWEPAVTAGVNHRSTEQSHP